MKTLFDSELVIVDPEQSSLTVQKGDNISLACVGDNSAVISWHLFDDPVTWSPDDHVLVTRSSDLDTNRQTVELNRYFMTASEAGEYQCRDLTKHLGESTVVSVHVASTSELASNRAAAGQRVH